MTKLGAVLSIFLLALSIGTELDATPGGGVGPIGSVEGSIEVTGYNDVVEITFSSGGSHQYMVLTPEEAKELQQLLEALKQNEQNSLSR